MESSAPHAPSPGNYPATVPQGEEEVSPLAVNCITGSHLRKWKSLEGDWRTFSCPDHERVDRGNARERSHKSMSESSMKPSKGGETDYAGLADNQEITGEQLRRMVNSSYPLLEENFSLLQKLKKERDVCRQLENDMRDLEGQIQNVSKSFHRTTEEDSKDGSFGDSEVGFSSEENIESHTVDDSYEEEFVGDNVHENNFCPPMEEELDPIAVIESTLSSLMDLAERLEVALRERELEMSQLVKHSSLLSVHHIAKEWVSPSYQLSGIPSELVDLLQDLQAALRLLLASRDWEMSRQPGDRDCSSPASFTFQSFGRGRVLVPTVRTIFSPVGDSVEMRPVQEQNGEDYISATSMEEFPAIAAERDTDHMTDNIIHDVSNGVSPYPPSGDLSTAEDLQPQEHPVHYNILQEDLAVFPGPSPLTPTTHEHQTSTGIIKRIEQLQELVKPELCESLKQRALRIQKAKEDFLSGVVIFPPDEPAIQEQEVLQTDILIEDVTVPVPNGLTVKDEREEKKSRFPFLRKKKRQSWGSEELCRESLVLEDKADWLRNPFRPKGKYKINK